MLFQRGKQIQAHLGCFSFQSLELEYKEWIYWSQTVLSMEF